jgi:hypothetical protein
VLVLGALGLGALASGAAAQERLTGLRTATGGVYVESYRFGRGLTQADADGGAPSVIRSAEQWSVPLCLVVPVGERWSVDVAATATRGVVRFAPAASSGSPTTASLAGLGDVRLRATGHLIGDNLLLTLGTNVASGTRSLSAAQRAALGVLAAPALGAVLPAASAGPSATAGLVYTTRRAGWSWAAGAAVEARGRFAPVAALSAGVPADHFDPGAAAHLSLGGEGLVGDGALAVALTADVYARDRVPTLDPTLDDLSAGPASAAVRLGPTLGADLRWRAPTSRFRELTLYAAERYRAPLTRGGARITGTAAGYLSAGGRASYPLGRTSDLTASLDVWHHTGLAAGRTLVTARTTSGAIGVGVARRLGTYTLQSYARLRGGTIDTGVGSVGVVGSGVGMSLTTRF